MVALAEARRAAESVKDSQKGWRIAIKAWAVAQSCQLGSLAAPETKAPQLSLAGLALAR